MPQGIYSIYYASLCTGERVQERLVLTAQRTLRKTTHRYDFPSRQSSFFSTLLLESRLISILPRYIVLDCLLHGGSVQKPATACVGVRSSPSQQRSWSVDDSMLQISLETPRRLTRRLGTWYIKQILLALAYGNAPI